MMKLLVTGGNGQIAWDIKQQHPQAICLSKKDCDITSKQQILEQLDKHQPTIVINTAAYTAVDKAETENELAFAINANGAENIAEACQHFQIPLIHLSTDYVLDGKQLKPLNYYGYSKLCGEQKITEKLPQHIILRISAIFGIHGHNFVKTILKLAKEHEELRIVDDQITCPTPASDVARVILTIATQIHQGNKHWGVYQYCSKPETTWHAFSKEIVRLAEKIKPLKAKQIKAISTEELKQAAIRSKYSVLNCDKIYNSFAIEQQDWRTELEPIIKAILNT